jgi:hypothetical protein
LSQKDYSSSHSGVARGAAAGRGRSGSRAVARAMSGRWRQRICVAVAEWRWWRRGIGSGADAAADVNALLGSRCSARLESLGLLCSACIRVVGSRCVFAATGEYWGGGRGTWLALLGLSWGWAANALICAVRLRPRAKVRDDSSPLFARCALLGLRRGRWLWGWGGPRG